MKIFFIVFAVSSSPFFVLLIISTFIGAPTLYNLVCIGLAAVFSLITANNNRRSIAILPLTNYSRFIHDLRKQLLTMGYQSLICHEFEMTFMHPFKFSYYASDIIVKFSYDQATIIGPKKTIKYLSVGLEIT